jgi:hypothetical protein
MLWLLREHIDEIQTEHQQKNAALPIPSGPPLPSDHDKRLRAELAAELGWYPADLGDESIARHRADADGKKTDHDAAKRWAHLTERARQRDVEAAGRAAVADLYE